MKKTVKILAAAFLAALVLWAGISGRPVKADSPTDEIVNFTVTVDVNEDASLEMTYHIEWKVLYDGGGSEKLTWVNLGVPNKYHENITPVSSTISRIRDNGSTLRIDLDRGYGKGETVVFEFTMTQDHMYQIDKYVSGETVYSFTPAWFEEFAVDELVIRWNADKVGAFMPDCLEKDGYLTFTTSLSAGGTYTIGITYPNDAFGFSSDRQEDKGGSVPIDPGNWDNDDDDLGFFEVIGGLFGLGFLMGPLVGIILFIKWIGKGVGFGTEQATEKKITRTKIEYYETCPGCGAPREEGKESCEYCGRSLVKSKEVVEESQIEHPEKYTRNGTYHYGDSPNTYIHVNVINVPVSRPRSGGSGGTRSGGGSHHSSCASSCACASHCACASSCACACACASSGRAGCSVKDFFKESIHEGRVKIESKRAR